MSAAPLPEDEELRLRALYTYQILDTVEEEAFDDICQIAASICGTPMALITLLDRRRQWCKARLGFPEPETERDTSFCAHTILQSDLMVVEDTKRDRRFANNRLVIAPPRVRFYAGIPLRAYNDRHLGTLCVIDVHPRSLEASQAGALRALGRQVEMQLELRRVQYERTLLGHFVIHDMRNPLTAMLGNVHQAFKDVECKEELLEDLHEIETATARVHRMVENLQDLLTHEEGGMPVRFEQVDVGDLLEALRTALRGRLAGAGVRLETDVRAPVTQADPELLRRVLDNLMFNALEIVPAGSTIRAETWTEGDDFVLRVTDEGPGVPRPERQSIFGLGQRGAATGRRGTGFGLTFCRMAVRAMGGRIEHEEPASGVGASFRVTLPR